MLSENARFAVNVFMTYGCTLQVFPYRWDRINFRLYRATRLQNWLFNVHSAFMFFYYSFITFRLISTISEKMPILVRLIVVVWVVAYGLTSSSTIQFYKRREEIMFFANALFDAKEKRRVGGIVKRQEVNSRDRGASWGENAWSSSLIILSSLILYTSGPAHAIVLFAGPCNPTYISSVIHNCTSYFDMPLTTLEATPYVFYEYYIIGFVLAVWSFNWSFIFMGWLWIKGIMEEELSKSGGHQGHEVIDLNSAEYQYRHCQVLAILLNDAFAFYLRAFPSVLFTMAGLMLFATIRYTDLPYYLYLVFPSCGLRCLYEATTALAAAGMMHQESIEYLATYKRRIDTAEKQDRRRRKAFYASCRPLLCTAGSMYTFENSILLKEIHLVLILLAVIGAVLAFSAFSFALICLAFAANIRVVMKEALWRQQLVECHPLDIHTFFRKIIRARRGIGIWLGPFTVVDKEAVPGFAHINVDKTISDLVGFSAT